MLTCEARLQENGKWLFTCMNEFEDICTLGNCSSHKDQGHGEKEEAEECFTSYIYDNIQTNDLARNDQKCKECSKLAKHMLSAKFPDRSSGLFFCSEHSTNEYYKKHFYVPSKLYGTICVDKYPSVCDKSWTRVLTNQKPSVQLSKDALAEWKRLEDYFKNSDNPLVTTAFKKNRIEDSAVESKNQSEGVLLGANNIFEFTQKHFDSIRKQYGNDKIAMALQVSYLVFGERLTADILQKVRNKFANYDPTKEKPLLLIKNSVFTYSEGFLLTDKALYCSDKTFGGRILIKDIKEITFIHPSYILINGERLKERHMLGSNLNGIVNDYFTKLLKWASSGKEPLVQLSGGASLENNKINAIPSESKNQSEGALLEKNRIFEFTQKYFGNVIKQYGNDKIAIEKTFASLYFGERLTADLLQEARKYYAKYDPTTEKPLLLIDITVFGHDKGILLTDDALYDPHRKIFLRDIKQIQFNSTAWANTVDVNGKKLDGSDHRLGKYETGIVNDYFVKLLSGNYSLSLPESEELVGEDKDIRRLREEWKDKLTYSERNYIKSIELNQITVEISNFFSGKGFRYLQINMGNSIEVWVRAKLSDAPYVVKTDRIENGIKISFGRIGAGRTLGESAALTLITGGLAMLGGVAVAAFRKKLEEEFWSFIENKINNLGQQISIQKILNEQQPPIPIQQEDIIDKIRKISALKEQGILTEEEFQAKKKDLIARL